MSFSTVSGRAGKPRGSCGDTVPMRVCFALPDFDRLGAQRVAVWIAKSLPTDRFEASFLVHDPRGEMREQLPSTIPVVTVDEHCPAVPRLRSVARLAGYLRCLKMLRPDVVVGVVQYPTLAVAACLKFLSPRPRLIGCEHSFVSKNLEDPEAYPPLFRQLYRLLFPLVYNDYCSAVVVTAAAGGVDLVTNWRVRREQVHVIPNPVDLNALEQRASEPLSDPWLGDPPLREGNGNRVPVILAAGRLVFQKRFDILIDAFGLLRQSIHARLLILGAGEWEGRLREMVIKHGVQDSVRIENQSPPWRHMARADVFALSSEWEGFPMVLAEAMAIGCPIVSVRCPSGPAEMLDEGEGGLLTQSGDPHQLAQGLRRALQDPEASRRRAAHARRKAMKYSTDVVSKQYTALFENVLARS